MRNILILFNILLFILLLGFCANAYINSTENARELLEQRKITDRQIEELEKEIRVLKTDINIIQYGYEEKMLDK